MPTVTIVIPTKDRPELLKRAIASVRMQTYKDWELIIVDDGSRQSVQDIIEAFGDQRIRCIRNERPLGGGAARNAGIRTASGTFIAFLDDDDEWLPEKIALQVRVLTDAPSDVGFCFTAVRNRYGDHDETTTVPSGIVDCSRSGLGWFKWFLTVTLLMKREVFDRIGYFDECLPSHQESDLVIRTTRMYRGFGINRPLVLVSMMAGHVRIGTDTRKRILGREAILQKYRRELLAHPDILAQHYFELGLFYRKLDDFSRARDMFRRAFLTEFSLRRFLHYVSMACGGMPYRFLRRPERF